MIPNHYIKNGCFTKPPLKNGCLGFQVCISLNKYGYWSNFHVVNFQGLNPVQTNLGDIIAWTGGKRPKNTGAFGKMIFVWVDALKRKLGIW